MACQPGGKIDIDLQSRRGSDAEPRSKQGNPPFYSVLGRRYVVLDSADGFIERGVASWYGPTFHGELTSNGESYNMYAMSAAHKTLPLPAYARVTNLSNGKSVVVRVNDRGPFAKNRIIDLSYTAAAKLDMLRGNGTALVEVRAARRRRRRQPAPNAMKRRRKRCTSRQARSPTRPMRSDSSSDCRHGGIKNCFVSQPRRRGAKVVPRTGRPNRQHRGVRQSGGAPRETRRIRCAARDRLTLFAPRPRHDPRD